MIFVNNADLFLTLSDENNAIFQAEHIIITDINQVICWHRGASNTINWYHRFDDRRLINRQYKIPRDNDSRYFGWYSERTSSSSVHQQLKLLKDVNNVQIEGFFFCAYHDRNNDNNISIGIHYPSEFA